MFKYKLIAAAISIFVVFAEELSFLNTEENETNVEFLEVKTNTKKNEVSEITAKPASLTVSASVYFPEPDQTDDTPLITADGSVINEKHPRRHRWIAVSRDLLSRWGGEIRYGDSLMVTGISDELDGLYIVRDTMHRRIRNRIDILVGRKDNIIGFWENIQISKVN